MTSPRWVLPPQRAGQPASAALAERRAAMAAMQGDPALEPGTSLREAELDGVACLIVEPEPARRTVLYLHGGGYRLGAPAAWAAFASRLAAAAAARVVLPDYRLAPEHPFPAALHDSVAVYDALLDSSTEPLVVGGDSAGGGLAAALTVACAASAVPLPHALVLISPWVDLSVRAGTYASRAATDQLFSADAAREAAAGYLQGHEPTDPLASPLFGELAGFPPTLVFGGGDEVLLDDALGFAMRLADAGVSVELHAVRGMQHVWPTLFPELAESARALEAIARFVEQVG